MFSHTSRPRSRIWGTSVRKHCFFFVVCVFFIVCFGFSLVFLFFNGSGSFLIDFIGFSMVFIGFTMVLDSFHWFLLVFHGVLLCFEWSPLVFHCFFGSRIGSERKTKGKLLENQSQPTPGPLRSFLLSLSLLWPPGLLWLALAASFLSLASFTRDKEEIRRWGLSGASFWASPSSVFSLSRVTERGEYSLGCTGPALGPSFLCFSYSACSGAPSPGLPLSLSLSFGLLWAPLAGSDSLLPLSVFFYA